MVKSIFMAIIILAVGVVAIIGLDKNTHSYTIDFESLEEVVGVKCDTRDESHFNRANEVQAPRSCEPAQSSGAVVDKTANTDENFYINDKIAVKKFAQDKKIYIEETPNNSTQYMAGAAEDMDVTLKSKK